uniref:Uncharacterized protein n=1 Tax=Pipistrellus kuhlii TaxID=59472 RepID=A0A7J7ZFC6_PIPKU|nr:hypothetical protein mPipKuh1_000637 [Pipistrellus kuhlii]
MRNTIKQLPPKEPLLGVQPNGHLQEFLSSEHPVQLATFRLWVWQARRPPLSLSTFKPSEKLGHLTSG